MNGTLYRRPLPQDAVAFSSREGRQLFAEALAEGGLDGYFRLAEQFHTQSDPSFCGLASLVVALNGLGIDPGRLWRAPWRWFSEDLLDCCGPLEDVRQRGLNLDQLACLARCNGADAVIERAEPGTTEALRSAILEAARGEAVLIASYDRASLGQTGAGHFSPIGGYHAGRDLALILDVARFKYPPHWISVQQLWTAMRPLDPETNMPRGWLRLIARPAPQHRQAAPVCDHASRSSATASGPSELTVDKASGHSQRRTALRRSVQLFERQFAVDLWHGFRATASHILAVDRLGLGPSAPAHRH